MNWIAESTNIDTQETIPVSLLNLVNSGALVTCWHKEKSYFGVLVPAESSRSKQCPNTFFTLSGSVSEIKSCLYRQDMSCLKPTPDPLNSPRPKRLRKIRSFTLLKTSKNGIKKIEKPKPLLNGTRNQHVQIQKIPLDLTLELLKTTKSKNLSMLIDNKDLKEKKTEKCLNNYMKAGLALAYCEKKNSDAHLNGIPIQPISFYEVFSKIKIGPIKYGNSNKPK
ncbi:hypothetical protein MXB_3189 [Myxobolus squamalis]|nr:hypothetical protein MXB_3189 [Myxobolus squamalis]